MAESCDPQFYLILKGVIHSPRINHTRFSCNFGTCFSIPKTDMARLTDHHVGVEPTILFILGPKTLIIRQLAFFFLDKFCSIIKVGEGKGEPTHRFHDLSLFFSSLSNGTCPICTNKNHMRGEKLF